MKRLLILLAFAAASCNNAEQKTSEHSHGDKEKEHPVATVPLNQDAKWKADDATKRNVAAMQEVLKDSSSSNATKRTALQTALQEKIDTLVKECRMQGAPHDALHVWLEKVLDDLKEWKENGDEEAYADLKKDVASFDTFFE